LGGESEKSKNLEEFLKDKKSLESLIENEK